MKQGNYISDSYCRYSKERCAYLRNGSCYFKYHRSEEEIHDNKKARYESEENKNSQELNLEKTKIIAAAREGLLRLKQEKE